MVVVFGSGVWRMMRVCGSVCWVVVSCGMLWKIGGGFWSVAG